MRIEVEVICTALNIRPDPNTNKSPVGVLNHGAKVVVDKASGSWYHLESNKGWISSSSSYVKKTKDLAIATTPAKTNTTTPTKDIKAANTTVKSGGIDAKMISMLYANQAANKGRNDQASTRLFGSPFQFLKTVDFRLDEGDQGLGRKYLENIVSEAPIVYFIPGIPNYLPDVSEEQRSALTSFFNQQHQDNKDSSDLLTAILGDKKEIRYFDFITDYTEYIRYVNLLCRMAAIYLGIENNVGPNGSTKYKFYDWGDYKFYNDYKSDPNKKPTFFEGARKVADELYDSMFGKYKYVQFYVQPTTSFSESSSNATNNSKLESLFDTAEGLSKELSFLTNTAALHIDEAKAAFGNGMEEIGQKISNGKDGFFSRLLSMSNNVLSGSNIIFPEVWGDASYNKSYSVTLNLVSPYGDKESIYINIIVPMLHMMALSLPRQTSANSYASPFLVKAFAKGWFSCELGIIDSISIEKGGGGDSWTVDGLPSEVKVTVNIKDLYNNLMITPTTEPKLFFQNQGLIEFLAVTCGLDITKPNFLIKLETMYSVFYGNLLDVPTNIYREFIQGIQSKVDPLFKIYGG